MKCCICKEECEESVRIEDEQFACFQCADKFENAFCDFFVRAFELEECK